MFVELLNEGHRAVVPGLFGTTDCFCGRELFPTLGEQTVSGGFKSITFTGHFISTIITFAPPQIIMR